MEVGVNFKAAAFFHFVCELRESSLFNPARRGTGPRLSPRWRNSLQAIPWFQAQLLWFRPFRTAIRLIPQDRTPSSSPGKRMIDSVDFLVHPMRPVTVSAPTFIRTPRPVRSPGLIGADICSGMSVRPDSMMSPPGQSGTRRHHGKDRDDQS